MELFAGRKAVVATMHGKESVIVPAVEKATGLQFVPTPAGFNTDAFGTFSSEVARKDDPRSTARRKCLAAIELTGCEVAIASEGSFGPHPTIFFAPADDEIIVMVDKKLELEIAARTLTTKTNFAGAPFTSWADAEQFAQTVQFPAHRLIAKAGKDDLDGIVKGIGTWEELKEHFDHFLGKFGVAFLETDMRAMYNPTRMEVIRETADKLVTTILRLCPACKTPGFDVKEVVAGLPCEWCGTPTQSTLAYVYGCSKCHAKQEQRYPHGKRVEDPMYCDWCNP
jgi:hypothetical protein